MFDIKKLRELCEKATPEPWEVGKHRGMEVRMEHD
jgi:hypothetical protein